MITHLQKGANAPITNASVQIGIGWNEKSGLDIDASAFLIDGSGHVRSDRDFVFYNQRSTPCGSLVLEDKAGADHRLFNADLTIVPPDISKIVLVVTLDEDIDEPSSSVFAPPIHIRILERGGAELMRFDVTDIEQERALILGEVYRYQAGWKFRAVGQGYNGGLGAMASAFGVNITESNDDAEAGESEDTKPSNADSTVHLKRRRSSKQIWAEKAAELHRSLKRLIPQIQAAAENQINESNTRMILDKILMDVFGYSMNEVKAEQRVQGRKADYVLAIDEQDVIVGESKRAGCVLRDNHVFQATSYGAYSGIRWALLTNLVTWRVYHISTQDMVKASLVFTVDLLPDVTPEDCEKLLMITRFGMTRKRALEKHWGEVNALTKESLIRAILTEDVIGKIRAVIKRDTGFAFDNELIQQVLEETLIHP